MGKESNSKRTLILAKGKELFWKFGFRRVTVEEICKNAGISKMTYYKHFSNKMELVKTIMDEVIQDSMEKYKQIQTSDDHYPDKVLQMIQLKREGIKDMSNEFFRDYMQSEDPEMIQYLNQISLESLQMFTNDFKKAQDEGDIRKDLKVEFITYILNHMIAMMHEDQLLNMYEDPHDLVMEITNFLFYGILNRDVHT